MFNAMSYYVFQVSALESVHTESVHWMHLKNYWDAELKVSAILKHILFRRPEYRLPASWNM